MRSRCIRKPSPRRTSWRGTGRSRATTRARVAGFVAALAGRLAEATLSKARALYEHSLKGFRSGMLSANDLSLDEARLTNTSFTSSRAGRRRTAAARLLRDVGLPLVH